MCRILPLAIVTTLVVTLPSALTRADAQTEKLDGYAEYRLGHVLIVDGQRTRATSHTRVKGKGVRDFASIPLGHRVEAQGVRAADGAIDLESIWTRACALHP